MSVIFLKIFNMSVSASYIVLAVILLRLLLKKAPKWITVALWGIVGVRLVCPFSIESVFSLIPSAETVSPDIMMDRTPEINTGIPILNQVLNPVISGSFMPATEASVNPLQLWIPTFAIIWIIGTVALIIYTLISYAKTAHKVSTAVLYKDNIYQSENAVSPFVLGIIKPKIYLPFNISEKDMAHVVAHETAHIRRKDHLWKPLGFLLLTLHWFNPLLWLGYTLFCRDIELACDEKVIKELDRDARADYSEALLTCSVNRRMIAACPLAFGETGIKGRVRSVLNYKKPAFWIIFIAAVTSVAVAVCFLTNPQQKVKSILTPNTSWSCEDYELTFRIDQNYIIEGEINTPDYSGIISIGYRYAGKNAVAEIFKGDWEYAQAAAEEPLLSGKLCAANGKLIFKISKDNVGLNQEELTFYKTALSATQFHSESFTDYEGVYLSVKSIDTNAGGLTVFNLLWHNETNEHVTYGEPYIIERKEGNEWIDTSSEKLYFTLIGLLLPPNSTDNKSYSTQGFDISESGTYRLRTSFFINEESRSEEYNTWIVFEVGSIPSVSSLREKYPEFFGLNAEDGLTVYIWQFAKTHYSCCLVSTATDSLSDESFAFTGGASISEIRSILNTYSIDREKVLLRPISHPLSSYFYTIDEAYCQSLEDTFWSVMIPMEFNNIYDTATFDIDGDGVDEVCTMSVGPTSGVFTFTFNVREVGMEEIKYHTIIYSPFYDLSFQKGSDGVTRVQGVTQGKNPVTHLFDISIKDGYVYLTENGVHISEKI